MPRLLSAALTAAAILWLAMLLLAPAGLASGTAPVPAALAYRAGAVVCHQRPERSFRLAGVPLPVCARCTGLYASGAMGALAAWLVPVTVARRARVTLLAAALPTAATVALEWAGVLSFSNTTRALASLPLGAAAGWIFVRMLRAEAGARHAL